MEGHEESHRGAAARQRPKEGTLGAGLPRLIPQLQAPMPRTAVRQQEERGFGAGLTVSEGVQVAKDTEAVVGPFGGHSQLPQGCADLYQENCHSEEGEKPKTSVCSGLVASPGGTRVDFSSHLSLHLRDFVQCTTSTTVHGIPLS